MRMSDLAGASGVSVATVKFYLRERLLPPGVAISRTSAEYDQSHVDRIRLIRSLTEGAGLDLATVRRVIAVLDDPPADRQELLGAAQAATLSGDRPDPHGPAAALMARLGWQVDPEGPLLHVLDGQLDRARRAGVVLTDEQLLEYARTVRALAEIDVASVPPDPDGAVRQVTVGTLLTDPVLATLRRLAHQDTSTLRVQGTLPAVSKRSRLGP